MANCPGCGAEILPLARYCGGCGADLKIRVCPRCHTKIEPGKHFCTNCGSPLDGTPLADGSAPSPQRDPQEVRPAPPPAEPRPAVPPRYQARQSPPRRRGFRWRFWGCSLVGLTMFLCLILVGLASAAYFGVPARLGLVKPGVDKYFSPTPDRLAAADLKEELKKAGVNPQGMELYVLPVAGKQESVAYAVLDASQGFKFPAYQGRDPLIGYMNQLVSGETAKKNNITRVAIDYRSASGKPLMTMTSSTADLSGLLKGEISREEFMKRLDGRADWQALLEEGLQ